jgi:enamine deaminase RidA (YjgF/YER057c/UK114 family)
MATSIVSEKTLIPVSLLTVVMGGVFWLSSMYAKTNANAEAIVEIKDQTRQDREHLDRRLNRIEAKLDRVIERRK